MEEKDILYQNGDAWVIRAPKGYKVVRLSRSMTHGEVIGFFGDGINHQFARAKEFCDRQADWLKKIREKGA